MKTKNLFITGGTGKIARFLIENLTAKDYNITLLCRKGVNEFNNYKLKLIIADILDTDTFASSLEGIDLVLHMAGITHTNRIKEYYEVNSEATSRLIKACNTKGVKRFIFVSTRAISENGGDYSKSKLIAENYVRESGLDWVIVRLSEVYGINAKNGVDMILKNIDRFPFIPIIGNGEYEMAPVHISDVISTLNKVIESPDKTMRVYNIAGPESLSFNEFIEKVLNLKQLKRKKFHIPVNLFRCIPKLSALFFNGRFLSIDQVPRLLSKKSDDISLAKSELGYNPIRLEDAII